VTLCFYGLGFALFTKKKKKKSPRRPVGAHPQPSDAHTRAMQFLESEQRDATRLAWCTWPSTRLEASRLVVPLSAVYQPLKPIETLAQMQYDPVSFFANLLRALDPSYQYF
jgi:hypothetical protein